MTEQTHRSDPRILNQRTLQHNHRRLADLLRPGMVVLDVGCGTGAITAGIARMVSPKGYAVGVDRDNSLLTLARQEHSTVENLSFENGDVLSLDCEARFDIVTTARMLQWISDPGEAIRRLRRATKTGGHVVALDYNHENNAWIPDPPAEFLRFYRAFLEWRVANKWDNRIGDRLPDLFQSAGITDIQIYVDDEIAQRGDPSFLNAGAIWLQVIQSIGTDIMTAGFLDKRELLKSEEHYAQYLQGGLHTQTLSMRSVVGKVL
jgi:SAM-dependent methyltransferase